MGIVVTGPDPVTTRRARIARLVKIGKRLGYTCLLVSIVAFFAAVATDLPAWLVAVAVAGLVAACVILPVPIILGYGLHAAEREERGGRGH